MDRELQSGALECAPTSKEHAPIGNAVGSKLTARGRGKPHLAKQAPAAELPPIGITRWVIRRKAQLVAAVQTGAISLEDACARYAISSEEFRSWERSLERHGVYGLRTTRSQIYRSDPLNRTGPNNR